MAARVSLLAIVALAVAAWWRGAGDVSAGDDRPDPASAAPAQAAEKPREVAGKADYLRDVPKHFARLVAVDAPQRTVTLHIEGEASATTWPVIADAEVKVHGWWGRLEHLQAGDRLWVWFTMTRDKQRRAVLMLADEPSQQRMHGRPPKLLQADAAQRQIVCQALGGPRRSLTLAGDLQIQVDGDAVQIRRGAKALFSGRLGDAVYVQTSGEWARLVVGEEGFLALRRAQQQALRAVWLAEGLPATVTFLHPAGGEMEVMFDHEALRYARLLNTGDEVQLLADAPRKAVVKFHRPWRERTQVRLVTASGLDQADLQIGQRLGVRLAALPEDALTAQLPPDADRPRSTQERVEWFLCSTYCTCRVGGDRCTGMFYSLASCNVNACGMPNLIRTRVRELIDQHKSDAEILEILLRERGPLLLEPHLLP